jgi:threonylcarbamoyladenosine tRNA methylthiotransferase MtaB
MTSWGADLPGQPTLGDLVQRILKLVPDLKRLRLSSVDAVEIDDTLFRLFAEEERMMPHLHLSLQHGADMILKRMKRRHTREDAIKLTARLRAARPDIAFGADLIAGFPTETEAHFADSLALVDEVGLAFLHVFPFSPRPETPAARMPQLDKATIKARAALLRDKGQHALAAYLDSQIGTTQTVLIERDGKGRLNSFYDEAGAIGRRYARQDEIGTPFCVTVDFETLGEQGKELKDTVTVRERDGGAQHRVKISDLAGWLASRL